MLLKFGIAHSLLALALTFGLGATAYAQDSETPPMNPADVTNARLEKFANVNVKAQQIQEKYSDEVDAAKYMDDLNKVQQKMNGELINAIQAQDLSVEEYQALGTTVQQDPELRSKVMEKISEKMKQQQLK